MRVLLHMTMLVQLLCPAHSFAPRVMAVAPRVMAGAPRMAVASLTEATTWQARLSLRMPTNYGRIGERELSVRLVFEQEEGYEPPQGTIKPAAGGSVVAAVAG